MNNYAGDDRQEANEDEINCQEQHTEIFRDVYHVCLSLGDDVDLSCGVANVTIKGGSSSRRRGDLNAEQVRLRRQIKIAPESIRGRSTWAAGIKFDMAR